MEQEIRDTNTSEERMYLNGIEINPLTGLYFSHAFTGKADEFLKEMSPEGYCMVAIDLEHFRLFNKLYGREQGDELLILLADSLREYRKNYGGVIGYLGGDNFAVLTYYDKDHLKELRRTIKNIIKRWSNTVGFMPAFGIYPITDVTVPAATMYDRATIALNQVVGNYTSRCCVYSSDMEEKVEEELRLLSEIQEALQKEEFTFFVQPQCDISTGRIVGGESLVRWRHPQKGLIPPGVFVPVLEKNGFIASLDRYVWKKVCQWLREWLDKGYQPVPVSINVSRIDIFSMDVPAYLTELLQTYDLPAKLLKVEITESAYAESNDKIIRTVKQLQDAKLLVMMDDFGSGYSSLNMLKSIAVDVLKLDMRFLDINEQEESKGIGILESVVNMARQMRMPIIVEGVETQKQESYLLKLGCRYSQGYYYYKPMPIEEFEQLISDEHKLDLDGIWCKQVESFQLKEFLDRNLFSDAMVNNILGPAAIYDMYENNIEVTRVNEQYYNLSGISNKEAGNQNKKSWIHVRHDDRQLLFSIFAQAYENPASGASGYVHFVRVDGVTLWIQIRIYFMRERDGHKLFFGALTDLTDLHDKKQPVKCLMQDVEELTENQRRHIEKYYGDLPCGCAIAKVLLNDVGVMGDYDIIYANREISRISGGNIDRLRFIANKAFADKKAELFDKAYRAAYLGEKVEFSVYSPLSYRYLRFTFGQFQHGYVSCMLQDETHEHIYESTLQNILLSYREVYFIHLQDNYCRMIYPDDNHMLERGNYEEVVNRHFAIGKILDHDEKNVRQFLSLENLREVLAKQDTTEYKYRRSVQGMSQEWCLTSINVCERADGVPKTAIMTIRSIESLMREREEFKRQNMAEILANMSEGFFVYKATGGEKILYANPTVLRIFGCKTMDEFRELVNNSFQGMVHPEDRNRVNWEISEQVKQSDRKMDFIRYRIIRKDGEIRWIDDCGHLEDSYCDEENKLFYVFITDVTEEITGDWKDKLVRLSEKYNQ
ncbi:MAG: EAL domain-containing protein [Lachnospiraceae bacterium]|nr:EAL domain-containing protein [Lachnospiraceae bacterium]